MVKIRDRKLILRKTFLSDLKFEEFKTVFFIMLSIIIGLLLLYYNDTEQIVNPFLKRHAVLVSNASFGLALSMFVALFVTSKVGAADRKRHEESLRSIHEDANKNVFETVFKRIVPDEIFETVKSDVILSEVCRNDLKLRYEFQEEKDGSMVLIQRSEYKLLNITHKELTFSIPLSDKYNSKLVSAQCEINNTVTNFDSAQKNKLSKNVKIKKKEPNEIILIADIPPENSAKIVTTFKKTFSRYLTKRITQEYFFKHPTIRASVEILFPQSYDFEIPYRLSPLLKPQETTETRRSFIFSKAILPNFGFIFSIKKKAEPVQNMEALGIVTDNIIHNFNNQIHVIIGTLELAYIELQNQKASKKSLDSIKKYLERFRGTLSALKNYSEKSKTGGAPLKFSLEINEAIKFTMAKSSVKIIRRFEAVHDIIMSNSTQIRGIIIKLLHKLSELKGGNTCILELELKNIIIEQRAWVELKISRKNCSENILICKEISDELKFRENDIRNIDLVTIKEEVNKWDGVMTFKEEKDYEPVFIIKFPVIENQFHSETFSIDTFSLVKGKNEKILFVDDDPQVSDLTESTLIKLGYQVVRFISSEMALSEFKKNYKTYDLVITDTNMPNISGISLGKEIKKLRPDIPIIISTGGDDRIDQEKAQKLDFQLFLSKPYSSNEIANAISTVFTAQSNKNLN